MIAELDDAFWAKLLRRMEKLSVIPVVGPGAITFGADDELLHPWLAQKVAEERHLQFPVLPKKLQQVVDAERDRGEEGLEFLNINVFKLLKGSEVHPGVTLLRLASIKDFQLFLTTSFDDLLADAVAAAQPAARPPDWVLRTSFRDGFRDLPANIDELPYACVYHLLGKIRRVPECALWDDDALAFLRELDQHLRRNPGHLSAALRDCHLLFLGVSLDNWLMRFLVQAAKGKHPSKREEGQLYLSETPETAERDQVVAFFSRLTHECYAIPLAPREFIAELARRWRDAHLQSTTKEDHRLAHRAPGCIFVSYAAPDLLIAEFIVKQLQDKGLLVWFAPQQILPGQDWKAEFSEAVETTCGIFLSLISNNTAARLEGYNIKERNLAIQRREDFADTAVFYIPMRIDEGEPLVPASEPRSSKKIQAVRKVGGHLDDAFIEYLRQLQLDYIKRRGPTFTPPPPIP